jgi:hypothetical protein
MKAWAETQGITTKVAPARASDLEALASIAGTGDGPCAEHGGGAVGDSRGFELMMTLEVILVAGRRGSRR